MSATSGSYKSAGLPNIAGFIGDVVSGNGYYGGAFRRSAGTTNKYDDRLQGASHIDFSASFSNSIYGNSTTVQPASYTVKKIIKY